MTQKDCNENILFAKLQMDQIEQCAGEIDRQQQKTDTNYFNKRKKEWKKNFDGFNG